MRKLTIKIDEYQTVNRKPIVFRVRSRDFENIAHASNRVNPLGFRIFVHLVPQSADQDINHVRLGIETISPDTFQDQRLRNDLPGILHQILEKVKLPGLQVNSSYFPEKPPA